MTSKETVRVAVFALNASGEPDFLMTEVSATPEEVEFGLHYEMAGLQAEQQGYDVRMTADKSDPVWKAMNLTWRSLHEDIEYAAALAVCDAIGVNFTKETVAGMGERWKWSHAGKVCYGSEGSREESALNAMRYFYQRASWSEEVANGDTDRGYLEWAVSCAERDAALTEEAA